MCVLSADKIVFSLIKYTMKEEKMGIERKKKDEYKFRCKNLKVYFS